MSHLFISTFVCFCRERLEDEALERARKQMDETKMTSPAPPAAAAPAQTAKEKAAKERERLREQERRRRAAVSIHFMYLKIIYTLIAVYCYTYPLQSVGCNPVTLRNDLESL